MLSWRKEVTQAEGLGEEGGSAGNLNEASRLRVIPLISHEGPRRREEAMIAELWHYPAMKKELPFTLCVLCDRNVVSHWLSPKRLWPYHNRDKRFAKDLSDQKP
jgi:hypothetical protein